MRDGFSKRIYLDYAATTPVDERVLQAMKPYFGAKFGNPGSLHSFGQEAIGAVDLSREIIATAIGLPPAGGFREIIFTGSATEANNLVLRGLVSSIKCQVSGELKPRIVISAIEHESVLETARALEKEGVDPVRNSPPQGPLGARLRAGGISNGMEVIIIPVNKNGIVDLGKLKEALNERTVLVSIMYANNEIGTVQPIAEISKIIGDFRDELGIRNRELTKNSKFQIHNSLFPFFHTDAVQALQFLDCNVNNLGIDLMTISAHKIYGPKGIGALYVKNNNLRSPFISAIISGGGQEFGLRSGTENVPNIVGFGKAVQLITSDREKATKQISELKNRLWNGIRKIYPKAEINGNQELGIKNKESRKSETTCGFATLPNMLNVYFPDYKAEEIMIGLDLAEVAVSSGSACSSRATKTSHVVRALGYSEERARRSIRFSLGRPTTKQEIDTAIKIFKNLISRLKK